MADKAKAAEAGRRKVRGPPDLLLRCEGGSFALAQRPDQRTMLLSAARGLQAEEGCACWQEAAQPASA